MTSGIVSLEQLYGFARDHANPEALDGKSAVGRKYSKLAVEVVAAVPEEQGFYLWGRYDERRFWHNIYLGKAGFGKCKKALRARILEELRDERCCVWRAEMTTEELEKFGRQHYRKYIPNWQRSLRKEGTTHIAWASHRALSNPAVANIEKDLIETLNLRASSRIACHEDAPQNYRAGESVAPV